jgi:CelD/BcsL family acetyltransferase involved in cellulose biosynthesis
MHVEELNTSESLVAVVPEWQQLCTRANHASPFQTPEWLLPWCAHLFGGGAIMVLALRANGRLVGLAPLFLHGANLSCLSFLGTGVSDYLDILLEPEETEEGVETMIDSLRQQRRRWELCELNDLRSGSPVLTCAMPHEWCVDVAYLRAAPSCLFHLQCKNWDPTSHPNFVAI